MDDAPFAVPGDGCASEHLISRLLKLSPDMVAYYDPALRLAYANPKHEGKKPGVPHNLIIPCG